MTNYTIEQNTVIQTVATTNQSLLVNAVAGSGKTTTLYGVANVIPPSENSIALAFNKKIQEALAAKLPSHIFCSTFNSYGHAIYAKHKGRMKLNARKMGELTSEICNERDFGDYWHDIKALAEQFKKSGLIHPDFDELAHPFGKRCTDDALQEIIARHDLNNYQPLVNAALEVLLRSTKLARTSEIDFDDQIYMTTYFTPDRVWGKFDNILVDEAQDLSNMQHDMIARFITEDSRLIAVGDPYQAIYGWRGAASNSIDIIKERFGLQELPLSVCFRCPKKVIAKAQTFVPHIQHHDAAPDGTVIDLGYQWQPNAIKKGSVVLCRNNAPLVALAFALFQANIPAYFGGRDLAYGYKDILKKLGKGTLSEELSKWFNNAYDDAEYRKQYHKMDQLEDQHDALVYIMDVFQCATIPDMRKAIDWLFRTDYSADAVELSTIHRAKGKEWDTVYLLAPNLIPSRFAEKAAQENEDAQWMLQEEDNLFYVAVTRAQKELFFINLPKKEKEADNDE